MENQLQPQEVAVVAGGNDAVNGVGVWEGKRVIERVD
jgi:hypothetical protein